ncbi:heavy-metal-associated domain-containing protein [Sinorhizobium alkalisoli]|uniref:Heavy metal-binding protein n=1 Tax=Sinorhizobium alkalisoli TaxID=1752398 RepID=A0A1E3VIN5_9HYPH|nr:heavy-metal-associated domain-containing protein [Sinorhizobium alkalisoli]MCA1492051.1 heavy-metal-associated domain-containing protein [Ensifer sp. NBAIM29]ODR92806.1 heavy metal-binding protein [Sinorhizobium alkalisoli]
MHLFNIPDMTCGHCAAAVERAAKAIDPHAEVTVDLEAKTASIDSEVGSDTFIVAIKDAGYHASSKNSCCGSVA